MMENSNNLPLELQNIINMPQIHQELSWTRVHPPVLHKNYMVLQQQNEQGRRDPVNDAIDIIPTWTNSIPPEFNNSDMFTRIKYGIDMEHRPGIDEMSQNIPVRILHSVTVPKELLDQNGDYDVEVYRHPYVIIQHEPCAKETIAGFFENAEHTMIYTDENSTGMLWNKETYSSLFDYINLSNIQYIFLPFTMRRWSLGIDAEFIKEEGIFTSLLKYEEWCSGVFDKFWDKELFGNLSVWNLKVGIRVDCSSGENATEQLTKFKNEICWVLQFQALQRKLHWRVNQYTNDTECDITLIVTVSDKCIMSGIQVRRPAQALPENQTSIGLSLMWPFLQAAQFFSCVDVRWEDDFQHVCILWRNNNLAAFHLDHIKNIVTGKSIECWKPVTWDMKTIRKLWDRERSSVQNRDIQSSLANLRCLLQRSQIIQRRRSTDETLPSSWIV